MKREELREWVRRRGTHRLAAEALGLSLDGLRNNLYGRRPINDQTQLIVELRDQLAELRDQLAEALLAGRPPKTQQKQLSNLDHDAEG